MAVAITATEQDVYPPRVLVSVTGLTVGDSIEVYRVVATDRTLVRAGSDDSVSDTSFLRIDAEIPFGVPVSYVAIVNGATEYATASDTYTLTSGLPIVTDAVSGQAAEAKILAWDEKRYNRQSSVFRVGGRNVIVADDYGMFEGTVEFFTEATSSRDNLMSILTDATEGVVQLRQPGGYDGVDAYLAVTGVSERRFSQDGSDERRIIAVDVVETESWAPALEARGFTLQDIADVYNGTETSSLVKEWKFNSTTESWTTGTRGLGAFTLSRVATPSQTGDGSLRGQGTLSSYSNMESPMVSLGTPQANVFSLLIQSALGYADEVRCAIYYYTSSGSDLGPDDVYLPSLAAGTWTPVTIYGTPPAGATQFTAYVATTDTVYSTANYVYLDYVKAEAITGELKNLSDDYATLLDLAQADLS